MGSPCPPEKYVTRKNRKTYAEKKPGFLCPDIFFAWIFFAGCLPLLNCWRLRAPYASPARKGIRRRPQPAGKGAIAIGRLYPRLLDSAGPVDPAFLFRRRLSPVPPG
jgi:hypothetical protein